MSLDCTAIYMDNDKRKLFNIINIMYCSPPSTPQHSVVERNVYLHFIMHATMYNTNSKYIKQKQLENVCLYITAFMCLYQTRAVIFAAAVKTHISVVCFVFSGTSVKDAIYPKCIKEFIV